MVTKSKKEKSGQKKRIKVLNLNKETVKDLTGGEGKRVKGGIGSLGGPSGGRQSYITPNNTQGASCIRDSVSGHDTDLGSAFGR
jgi:hypothetical protein